MLTEVAKVVTDASSLLDLALDQIQSVSPAATPPR